MFEYGDERYAAYLQGRFPRGLGIQVYRRLLCITQEELAMQLGVTPSCVSSWENGRVSVSPERLQDISEIFGVSVTRLQNPDIDDVDKASHTAVYQGHRIHRMVLRVSHKSTDSWPESYNRYYHRYTAAERDRFAEVMLHASPKEAKAPWINFGPNGICRSRLDGSEMHIRGPVSMTDTIALAQDDRFSLGVVLGSLRKGGHHKAETFYADVCQAYADLRIPCPFDSVFEYMQVEEENGPKCEALNNDFTVLLRLERKIHVPTHFLVAITPYGKNLIRNNRWFPGSFTKARNRRGLYCYSTAVENIPMLLPQQVPVYIGQRETLPETPYVPCVRCDSLVPQVPYSSDEKFISRYLNQLESVNFNEVTTTLTGRADEHSRADGSVVRYDIVFVYDGDSSLEAASIRALQDWFSSHEERLADWVLP